MYSVFYFLDSILILISFFSIFVDGIDMMIQMVIASQMFVETPGIRLKLP